jgi:hypothetical protein
MGLMKKSSCSVLERPHQNIQPPDPNPREFSIANVEVVGNALVCAVIYPNCTTYEGRKVLVFAGVSERRIRTTRLLDPHFSDVVMEGTIVPVARFEPTARGWRLARICAAAI